MERPITKIDTLIFDGTTNNTNWEEWKQNYVAIVGSKHMEDAVKIVQLLQMLKGEPRRLLNNFVKLPYTTRNYRLMWNTLETQYGGIHRQRNSIYRTINKFPHIKKFNKENTMELESLLNTIEDEFYYESIESETGDVLNNQVKQLIPEHELQSYFWENGKLDLDDTLQNFTKFIRQKRKAYTQTDVHLHDDSPRAFFTTTTSETVVPVASAPPCEEEDFSHSSHAAVEAPRKYIPYRKRDDSVSKASDSSDKTLTAVKSVDPTKPERICTLCKQAHFLTACPEFRMMQIKDKFPYIMKNRLCIHCLNPGHIQKDCKFHPDSACNISGCKKMHHRSLHNYTENGVTYLCPETYVKREAREQAYVTQTPIQCNYGLEDGEYCAIRTTTVMLTCGPFKSRVVVAMDPCSNSTNIDADFAERMNLKVEETGITREISFIEGSAKINSSVVSFMLSPLNSNVQYPVKAYTVRNLITGTPMIDWNG